MNGDIKINKLFNVDKVFKYITKHWSYKKYSIDNNNKIKIIKNSTTKIYTIKFKVIEYFIIHQFFKLSNESISRAMIIKTLMFEDTYILFVSKIYDFKYLDYKKLYVLFWDDKHIIDEFQKWNFTIIQCLINGQIFDENHQGIFGKMKIKEIKNNKNKGY